MGPELTGTAGSAVRLSVFSQSVFRAYYRISAERERFRPSERFFSWLITRFKAGDWLAVAIVNPVKQNHASVPVPLLKLLLVGTIRLRSSKVTARRRADAGEPFEGQQVATCRATRAIVDPVPNHRNGPLCEFHVGVERRAFGQNQASEFLQVDLRSPRQKAVVADSMKATRRDVLPKPVQKPKRRQPHRPVLVFPPRR